MSDFNDLLILPSTVAVAAEKNTSQFTADNI